MILYDVVAVDRQSKVMCCVGSMLSKSEALSIKSFLEKFNSCDVLINKSFILFRRKK